MNTTKNFFTVDFFKKTITGSKTSFRLASKGNGEAYEELVALIARHPDFELKEIKPKKKINRAKRTYEGLNDKFINDYLSIQKNAAELLAIHKSIEELADKKNKKAFPLVKKWFLDLFSSEENPFDMDKAKEEISNAMIAKATESSKVININDAKKTAETEEETAAAVNE